MIVEKYADNKKSLTVYTSELPSKGNETTDFDKIVKEHLNTYSKIQENTQPGNFFSKILASVKKPEISVYRFEHNGIPVEISPGMSMAEIKQTFEKAKQEKFSLLTKMVDTLDQRAGDYVRTENITGLSKDVAAVTKLFSNFELSSVPANIKDKFCNTLKNTGLLNKDGLTVSAKSHFGFIAQHVVDGIKTGYTSTLNLSLKGLDDIQKKTYNDMPTLVATGLNNLSEVCANFHVSKLNSPQSPAKFVEALQNCANAIFQDNMMSSTLKDKCVTRMVETLKYAGFESSTFIQKEEPLTRAGLIKHEVGELIRFSNVKNYEYAAYAPEMLGRYTTLPPVLPKAEPVIDDSFEQAIASAQRAQELNVPTPTSSGPSLH